MLSDSIACRLPGEAFDLVTAVLLPGDEILPFEWRLVLLDLMLSLIHI